MKTLPVNEETLGRIIAELIDAQQYALGLVIAAVSRQLDIDHLHTDMHAQIRASKAMGKNPLAIRLAIGALAAVDAEAALRKPNSGDLGEK